MLKDKLSQIKFYEERSVSEYLCQIEEVQMELAGIGQEVAESEVVERMLKTLLLSFDSIYQSFCTNVALPSFEHVSVRLLQDEAITR